MLTKQEIPTRDQDTGTFADGLIGFETFHVVPKDLKKRGDTAFERDYGEQRHVNRSAVGFV